MTQSFATVLTKLKDGTATMAWREGWKENMCIYLVRPPKSPTAESIYPMRKNAFNGDEVEVLPRLEMRCSNNSIAVFLPSIGDLMIDDWGFCPAGE